MEAGEDGGGQGDPKRLVNVWVEEKREEAPSSPSMTSKDVLLPCKHAKTSRLGLAVKERGRDTGVGFEEGRELAFVDES